LTGVGGARVVEEQARALAEAIEAALPGWIERCLRRFDGAGRPPVDAAAVVAAAVADVVPRLRALLATDVDEQTTTPLALLREAVRYPTGALRAAGVPPVERDDFARARFPDDDYDLTPASWADVDPALAEPGIAWGAAKAWTHRARHGGAGTGEAGR
jgi:hypothetical protein